MTAYRQRTPEAGTGGAPSVAEPSEAAEAAEAAEKQAIVLGPVP
ncbi:hypothetical protein AB0O18_31075 [Streptomyces sp. NPDC093224]